MTLGNSSEVDSSHGQYLNLIHGKASGSGGCIQLLPTCSPGKIKRFDWPITFMFILSGAQMPSQGR